MMFRKLSKQMIHQTKKEQKIILNENTMYVKT